MSKKWHEIIMVFGYEILISDSDDSKDIIKYLMTLKKDKTFSVFTLVCDVHNGFSEYQVESDHIFPIIGFQVNDPSECATLLDALDLYCTDNPNYQGLSRTSTPKLYAGIQVNAFYN